jgi:hypothetical protein
VSVILKSGASGDQATVDPTSKALRGVLYDAAGNLLSPAVGAQTTAAGLLLAAQDEGGLAVPVRAGKVGSLGVGLGQLLFWEDFEGATFHSSRWTGALNTFTVANTAATGVNLNSGAVTTASAVTVLNSARRFERRMNQPLDVEIRARVSAVTNSVVELGLGDTTAGTTAIVNNGAFFRYTGASLTPVLAYNGTEITGSTVDMSANGPNHYDYGIFLEDFGAVFTVKRSDTGALVTRQRLAFPLSTGKAFSASHIPVMLRVYNAGSAPASAPVFTVGSVSVLRLDDQTATPMADMSSGIGLGGEVIPATGQQTASYANAAAPASATLSNTAAGYTTLGGQWQFAAVASTETDYALFGYTIPSPFSFLVTGVRIGAFNMGAAVATTPTLLQWAIAVNATAASLATTTAVPTSQAPVRVPLGSQSFPIGAAVGANVPDLDVQFKTPLFCAAGRVVVLVLKMPVGTATGSQIIRGTAMINGYFV